MALVTYFQAELPCTYCKRVGTSWIQSRLGDRGATYRVGDCPGADIPDADFEDNCLTVKPPGPAEPRHVLFSWTCEHCGLENFAEVVFQGGCILSIDRADLDLPTLERVHCIYAGLAEMIEKIIEVPLETEEGWRTDWLPRLKAALAAGKR
jgi:hypothetical protein